MSKRKILLQLDSDPQPSVFDAVVAIDAEVDILLRHGDVLPENVRELVHGCIFTRGPADLHSTAIFLGGADLAKAEALLVEVQRAFFGPMRVSVLLDPNGANTTAAAAVAAAAKYISLRGARATVLAATGPVGSRAVRLLASQGAEVMVASRSLERANHVCEAVRKTVPGAVLAPMAVASSKQAAAAIAGSAILIAAGAAGVELLSDADRRQATELKVAIDLSAVSPLGIGGIQVTDHAQDREGTICYGALGVGGAKMKTHKRLLRLLFEKNDQILDVEAALAVALQL
jgi:hypothetical protein